MVLLKCGLRCHATTVRRSGAGIQGGSTLGPAVPPCGARKGPGWCESGRMDREELGRTLRHARQRLHPEDVGLLPGRRRRVPGLRREEVALLAGVSVDYVVRLEQGRGPRPSA